MVNHKVVMDRRGWRLTCQGDGCHEATVIRYQWMTLEKWEAAQNEFLAQHPCDEIEDLDQVRR